MSHDHSNPGVRFTLRKRSIRKNPDDVNISSYNSDFLSGLFNDVAKISEQSDSEGSTKRGAEHVLMNLLSSFLNLRRRSNARSRADA
jgi:hypothetical protein